MLEQFIAGLCSIPEGEFTGQRIFEYLRHNRVTAEDLSPYLFFSSERYTRNLIHKTPLFESAAICWGVGQSTAIHSHHNQSGWMMVVSGKVQVHNFKILRKDPVTHYCELAPTGRFTIDASCCSEVDAGETAHRVSNPMLFGSQAVTLHIYSRPFNTCEVYDLGARIYKEQTIVNTTEFGVPKSSLGGARGCPPRPESLGRLFHYPRKS